MGFFKDVRKLSKQAKEISKDYDPAAQMRQANTMMQQMTAQAGVATSGESATAIVNSLHDTSTMVNYQPLVEAQVTVMPAGGVPFPSKVTLMGHAQLASIQPGATINVRYDPANTDIVTLQA